MEWNVVQVVVLLVSFVGGFIAGSWKISGTLATMQEQLKNIFGQLEKLNKTNDKVIQLESRIVSLEKENDRNTIIINMLIKKVGIEYEPDKF